MGEGDPTPLQAAIQALAHHRELDAEMVREAFDAVMRGEASPTQMAALLMGLRVRGDTPEVIAGAARAMRDAMVKIEADAPEDLVDTCGTGGGAVRTFNISTVAALVAAGAGVRIAKHGNRSFTSACGSADVLEALGIDIEVPRESIEHALATAGFAFMFAPLMHPAMRHVGPVRRELAIPTVMNVVGPLANPASAGRQVIGVADPGRLPAMAGAVRELGTVHTLVVHGEPGLDEVSPLGATHVVEIRGATVAQWTLDASKHGLSVSDPSELAGGDPADNARIVNELLAGKGPRGARAAVVLNAGAAIYVSGKVENLEGAFAAAAKSLDGGGAKAALERLREAYS